MAPVLFSPDFNLFKPSKGSIQIILNKAIANSKIPSIINIINGFIYRILRNIGPPINFFLKFVKIEAKYRPPKKFLYINYTLYSRLKKKKNFVKIYIYYTYCFDLGANILINTVIIINQIFFYTIIKTIANIMEYSYKILKQRYFYIFIIIIYEKYYISRN